METLSNIFENENVNNKLKSGIATSDYHSVLNSSMGDLNSGVSSRVRNPIDTNAVVGKGMEALPSLVNTFGDIYMRENTVASSNEESAMQGINTTMGAMSAGASIGSLAGPVGTAIGAGAGLLGGGIYSMFKSKSDREKRRREERRKIEKMRVRTRNERERDNRLEEGKQQMDSEIAIRQQQLGLINNY